ncbi:MAG: 7TM-DISM domain-containing protein [Rhodoferax sp.]|uniref:sensor histidine kinase n=1 Tax=Rhodoferax sp. TaxID=50421 RepID=UPI002637B43A|nr:7TM-DISM domain-containing protein [Rhodoferax sp.]MDD2880836.1 7TM-DISM domain-containing protein [Rhodoferax sp.]
MTVRLTFWFLLSLALGLACLPAAAQDLIGERAFFEDQHGALTLAQVKQAEFSDAGKIISRGYTRAGLWVRLKVDAPLGAQRLALRVFPAQLEDVTLFSKQLPDAGLRLMERTTWIDARPGPNIYYLRIQTSGPMLLAPRILNEAQAQEEDVARSFFWGAVLTSYVPLLIWLLALTVTRRQLLHPVFLLNLSLVVVSFFSWTGYRPDFFSPTVVYFLGVVNVFTGFLCIWLVFTRFGVPRWGKQSFTLLGVLYAPLFGLFFMWDRQLVLQLSTALGLVASLVCLPLTVVVFYRQKPSTWPIGVILFLALALGLRWFLTVHTHVPPVDSLASLLFFRIFFAMAFVAATLLLMDREKLSQLQTSRLNEAVARQRAESETQRRESQERFMTMLMHELKTPLAIIQLAASSLGRRLAPNSGDATRIKNINRSVDDLNALVERCASADQIDQGAMRMDKHALCLTSLIADVRKTLGASRITLPGPAQYMVYSDAQYLRLILLNLLSNALKYAPPDSPIELQFDSTQVNHTAGITLRVVNAVGAAGAPDASQVFARYYRAEGARCQVGAGLGLWLAQALAHQLGTELKFRTGQEQVVFSLFLELA